ncbi:multidrug ABC transporter permease [Actinorhabdospora filicis]|uniref:Multidrug ABC transporter permease n=1 Tax=Actinorhabdospora filicis TaxID=1785913 RepID=A0A9W6WB82_9ACTN|nr:ABC transporter ATP-binding protein [Actinorhabdospora filicis]GLZ78455.1 multidrug ABC transporter permease [Actinorhabdospora filicis]
MSTKASRGGSAASGVFPLIRVLPRISPGLSALLALLIAARVAGVVLLPLAIGRLITALTVPDAAAGAVRLGLVLLGVAFVLDFALEPVRGMVTAKLSAAVDGFMAQRTVEGALRPHGVAHLVDPDVADAIEQARGLGVGGHSPGEAVDALSTLLPMRLSGLACGVLLGWAGQWWMPVVVGAAWIIVGLRQDQIMARAVAANAAQTVQLRHASYLRDLAVTAPAAKELRLFGLSQWVVARFTREWWDGIVAMRRKTTDLRQHYLAGGLLLAAHLAVIIPLALSTSRGNLTAGALSITLQALLGMFALGYIGDPEGRLRLAAAAVPAALKIGALRASDRPKASAPAAGTPAREIRFEGVSFRYPGRDKPVLDGLDLVIPAGSSLAIVGDNGAGKSTIIKLLAGLYEPGGGRISVDGTDLSGLDPVSWRRRLAVVFQDFARYPFSVRDNIAFGAIEEPASAEAVEDAARRGGFLGVERGLAEGWDTLLTTARLNGTDLSGGQWQRLAMSRALYAARSGAKVLILDEPTAHLDIMAEHELYARFLELTAGLTTILVSHRFATVRLADRIAVIGDGRVTELGGHEELLAADGRYARMFGVQSAPFTQTEGVHHV